MSKYEYNKKYADAYKSKFDQIQIIMPKGRRQLLKDHAAERGESVNALINRLINEELKI